MALPGVSLLPTPPIALAGGLCSPSKIQRKNNNKKGYGTSNPLMPGEAHPLCSQEYCVVKGECLGGPKQRSLKCV